MKKILIIVALLMFVSSCWKEEENIWEDVSSWEIVETEDVWVIQESVGIIEWYWETLKWTLDDTRNVVDDINKRYENLGEL